MPNSIPIQPNDVIQTQDGSSTLYSQNFNDHYHSTFGAISESQYIFIDCGFKYIKKSKNPISILEIGFGTGLNALMTYLNTVEQYVQYTSLEPYALDSQSIKHLNYPSKLGHESIFHKLHSCPWEEFYAIAEHFQLRKLSVKLEDYSEAAQYDLVYFDAFSPTAQPELWSQSIFEKIYRMCTKGAILMTYSSKGAVKRALIQSGFTVTKIPGPKGKREITRAIAH